MSRHFVRGSYGVLTINELGVIMERVCPGETEYDKYVAFDLAEWRTFHKTTVLPTDFDILDLAAFYMQDNVIQRCEAESDYRDEMRKALTNRGTAHKERQ